MPLSRSRASIPPLRITIKLPWKLWVAHVYSHHTNAPAVIQTRFTSASASALLSMLVSLFRSYQRYDQTCQRPDARHPGHPRSTLKLKSELSFSLTTGLTSVTSLCSKLLLCSKSYFPWLLTNVCSFPFLTYDAEFKLSLTTLLRRHGFRNVVFSFLLFRCKILSTWCLSVDDPSWPLPSMGGKFDSLRTWAVTKVYSSLYRFFLLGYGHRLWTILVRDSDKNSNISIEFKPRLAWVWLKIVIIGVRFVRTPHHAIHRRTNQNIELFLRVLAGDSLLSPSRVTDRFWPDLDIRDWLRCMAWTSTCMCVYTYSEIPIIRHL